MKQYFAITLTIFALFISIELLAQRETYRPGGKIRIDFSGLPIEQSELRYKLFERGINLDSLDQNNLPFYFSSIENILRELLLKEGHHFIKFDPIIIQDTIHQEQVVHYGSGRGVYYDTPGSPPDPPSKTDTLYIKEEPIDYSCNGIGIYGQHIFKDKTLELFQVSNDIKAPDHYILGMGDELTVTIYGRSQADLKFTINEEGFIAPEGMPRIFLKGVSFGAAKPLLRQRFVQGYNFLPEQFTVRITSVRNITVNIFGDVVNNGSYSIPAVNTAFNAIVAAGGPTDIGGVRFIKLIQNGTEKLLDVYEFMLDPTVAFEYQLEENAVIFVPTAEKVVHIKGAVKRPCTYELEDPETLLDLIDYAGGLTDDANTERIQVHRIKDNKKILLDVDLKNLAAGGMNFDLFRGDTVMVYQVDRPLENFVNITGEVKYPGRFAFQNGMKVSDLLEKGKLLPNSKLDLAYLIRTNLDESNSVLRLDLEEISKNIGGASDLELLPKDELLIFGQQEFAENAQLSVVGAVRNPGDFPYDRDQNITVQDLILLADGLKPNAAPYGYIKRIDPSNQEVVDYIQVNLEAAMSDLNAEENLILKPNDQLMIYTTERYTELHFFEIDGAVREPGQFDYDKDLKITDLIYLSGGLSDYASSRGYILRSDINNPELKTYITFDTEQVFEVEEEDLKLMPMDYVFIQDKRDFTDSFPVKVLGAVRNPGEYLLGDSLTIRGVIDLAGGLKYEAASNHIDLYRLEFEGKEQTRRFVASFELNETFQIIDSTLTDTLILDSLGRFEFKPFDHLVVREIPGFGTQELVKVDGAVQFPGYYVLTKDGQTIADLIEEAGGLAEKAFPKGATLYRAHRNTGFVVIRLDKAIRDRKSSANLVLREGDLITVPKAEDVVYIRIPGTIAGELYPEKYLDNGLISVAYHGRKSSKWYIENFAAGFAKSAKRKKLTVERPNTHIQGTKKLFGFNQYPKVSAGSTIGVGLKRRYTRKRGGVVGEDEPVDWEKVLAKSLTTLTSIFGLIVLVNQVSN